MDTCSLCDKPFKNGDKLILEMPVEIVDGKPVQTDEESVRHEECDET